MRVGVSSGGRWRISMGPLGWLLAGWYLVFGLIWLCVWIGQVIAAWRAARRAA